LDEEEFYAANNSRRENAAFSDLAM